MLNNPHVDEILYSSNLLGDAITSKPSGVSTASPDCLDAVFFDLQHVPVAETTSKLTALEIICILPPHKSSKRPILCLSEPLQFSRELSALRQSE
jgi:hypothetical protein